MIAATCRRGDGRAPPALQMMPCLLSSGLLVTAVETVTTVDSVLGRVPHFTFPPGFVRAVEPLIRAKLAALWKMARATALCQVPGSNQIRPRVGQNSAAAHAASQVCDSRGLQLGGLGACQARLAARAQTPAASEPWLCGESGDDMGHVGGRKKGARGCTENPKHPWTPPPYLPRYLVLRHPWMPISRFSP
ncbi:hypothetical protein VTK56DRAFT_2938 [Thermocarpiscus australiensis]